ncbi:MAG: hypothetical protein ONB31_15015 [candidate division KSB1 bacterium]|nr:hypothetical protein [candidate division KSB1 bacterium]MDZ7336138.1 hypothetical protein [candidate division KSB1 bacterium]MDZ7357702.1 hypothetical protein [candidate division KSB1 bacterium]MDZ7401281.1 hypothetical protein [candidate division KSB1 bacterium]
MQRLIEILLNALPEAIGALIAAGIITLLSYLFVKRLRKPTLPDNSLPQAPPEPPKPEIYSNLPSRTEFIGRKKEMERVKTTLNSPNSSIDINSFSNLDKRFLALEMVPNCSKDFACKFLHSFSI